MRKEAFLYVALALACALVVVLAVQNRQQRRDYVALIETSSRPQPGDWWPSMRARTLDGRSVELGQAAGERQILYFFDPTCPVCEASLPGVIALQRALRQPDLAGVQMLGVSRQGSLDLAGYARSRGLAFPVAVSTPRIRSVYRVNLVPLLVVVDRQGRVMYSHAGAIGTKEQVPAILAVVRAKDRHVAGGPQQGE